MSAAVPTRRRALALLAALVGAAPAARAQDITGPQPRLPTERLAIVTAAGARHEFTVEMATRPEQQIVGLMFRREVRPDEGMLFDWGLPERQSAMWMRNTLVPLDMVFIAGDGRVRRIAERTVPLSLATVESGGPVRATLELAGGTAERLGLRPGDRVLHRLFGTAP